MKKPEEIKKGLECCFTEKSCSACPYNEHVEECFQNQLETDALAYIQQLESSYGQVSKALCGKENATQDELLKAVSQAKTRLAQVERERDAAVHDLEEVTTRVSLWHLDCDYCKDKEKPICENCKWEWRGVCEENTREG